jgi:hypothetical protein
MSTACSPTAGCTSARAGEVFKAFHVLDGHGLKLLARAGIAPVVITGRDSPAVRRRLADLGLADAHYRRGRQAGRRAAAARRPAASAWPHAGRHRRRLARPAAAGARRLRLRAGPTPMPRRGRWPTT